MSNEYNSDDENDNKPYGGLSSQLNNNKFKFDTNNQEQYQQQISDFKKHDSYFNQQQQQQKQQKQQQQQQQQQYNRSHHQQHQHHQQHNNSYDPYRFRENNNYKNNNNNNNNNNIHKYNNNNNFNSYYQKQNKLVQNHYDHKQNTPIHIRSKSKIISLKNINNWVKSILIQEYSKPNTVVFDICGGKLGDLQKWIKAQIKSLIVADISLESLKHGVERYNQSLSFIKFDITMIAVDCFSQKLLECFPKKDFLKKNNNTDDGDEDDDEERDISSDNEDNNNNNNNNNNEDNLLKVDLVSCQFALHYSFRTKESAMQLLKNVSTVLKDGGHFIGTIPNACLIVKKLRESGSNKFGNDVYNIQFKDKEPKLTAFGCEYKFYLEDAIDFLEEYLVHMDVLVELAKEFGLELINESDFHDFIYEKSKTHYDLLRKMHCFNAEGSITENEWEALGIYKIFVFKKISTNNNNNNNNNQQDNNNQQQQQNRSRPISENEIITNL